MPHLSLLSSLPSCPPSLAVLQTYQHSYYGAGNKPMLVDDLRCNGRESEVANCYGFRYTSHSYISSYESSQCSPQSSHVAGVKCISKYMFVPVCNYMYVVHHFIIGRLRILNKGSAPSLIMFACGHITTMSVASPLASFINTGFC